MPAHQHTSSFQPNQAPSRERERERPTLDFLAEPILHLPERAAEEQPERDQVHSVRRDRALRVVVAVVAFARVVAASRDARPAAAPTVAALRRRRAVVAVASASPPRGVTPDVVERALLRLVGEFGVADTRSG